MHSVKLCDSKKWNRFKCFYSKKTKPKTFRPVLPHHKYTFGQETKLKGLKERADGAKDFESFMKEHEKEIWAETQNKLDLVKLRDPVAIREELLQMNHDEIEIEKDLVEKPLKEFEQMVVDQLSLEFGKKLGAEAPKIEIAQRKIAYKEKKERIKEEKERKLEEKMNVEKQEKIGRKNKSQNNMVDVQESDVHRVMDENLTANIDSPNDVHYDETFSSLSDINQIRTLLSRPGMDKKMAEYLQVSVEDLVGLYFGGGIETLNYFDESEGPFDADFLNNEDVAFEENEFEEAGLSKREKKNLLIRSIQQAVQDQYESENTLQTRYNERTRMVELEYEDEWDSYFDLPEKLRYQKLRDSTGRVTIGQLNIPTKLERRLKDIVYLFPKSDVHRICRQLFEFQRAKMSGTDRRTFEEGNFVRESLVEEHQLIIDKLRRSANMSKEEQLEKLAKEEFTNASHSLKFLYGDLETAAYVGLQGVSSYATNYAIMDQIKKRYPQYTPRTHLDFGCGPGMSIWAAHEHWEGSIHEYLAIDNSKPMLSAASEILRHVPNVNYRRFLSPSMKRDYDIVTLSYVLDELLSEENRKKTLDTLWKNTNDFLIIVEPGTPYGFNLIKEARAYFLSKYPSEAHVGFPCPHNLSCPMAGGWCHFSQRFTRPKFYSVLKSRATQAKLTKAYEDEKYSYVVIQRKSSLEKLQAQQGVDLTADMSEKEKLIATYQNHLNESDQWSRVVNLPNRRPNITYLDVCTKTGMLKKNTPISKKLKRNLGYRASRRLRKGDLFPYDLVKSDVSKLRS